MNQEIKEIVINGKTYVEKDSQAAQPSLDGLPYCIVRTYSAGVFAGYVKEEKGQEIILLNARRLWQWYGAASLSQLSQDGVSRPNDCKFPCEVPEIKLYQVIEKIKATSKCKQSIDLVKIWKA